jgi:hypothetical protein
VTVRIAAQFTKDERDRNGLIPAAGNIAANSHDWRGVAVVRLDCVRVTDEIKDGGVLIPTVGIRHIELVDGDDADLLEDGPSSPAPDEWLDNGKGGK